MTRGYPQQRNCRSLWPSASLLPVPKRVDTDSKGLGELFLCKADEASEGSDIFTRFEMPAHQLTTLTPLQTPTEV